MVAGWPNQPGLSDRVRSILAARQGVADLVDVGAYVPGSNPLVDTALAHHGEIDAFLRQAMGEAATAAQSWARLAALVRLLDEGAR